MKTTTSTKTIRFAVTAVVLASFAFAKEDSEKPSDIPKILEVQVYLDRLGFSPGEIDGEGGKNTEKAIAAFKESWFSSEGLARSNTESTGEEPEERSSQESRKAPTDKDDAAEAAKKEQAEPEKSSESREQEEKESGERKSDSEKKRGNDVAEGELDDELFQQLAEAAGVEPVVEYAITEEDAAGPFVENLPDDIMKQAELEHLGYANLEEALAEKFHCDPAVLKKLNPDLKLAAGQTIRVPNVEPFDVKTIGGSDSDGKKKSSDDKSDDKPESEEKKSAASEKAKRDKEDEKSETSKRQNEDEPDPADADEVFADANATTETVAGTAPSWPPDFEGPVTVTVSKSESVLQVRDEADKLVFHAPVTSGSAKDPLPIGEWKVTGVDKNPRFNYNPDLFWDADESHSKAKIPPGPNNPVGVVWIDLSKEHYGLHGSPQPGKIGYTESHGCVRLTNWDAIKLTKVVKSGVKVNFTE